MKSAYRSRIARQALRNRRFIVPAVLAASALPAYAVDYSATGNLETQVSHYDNLRMSRDDKVSTNKYMVTPTIRLMAESENTQVSLNSIFYVNRYDASEYNSDDQNIGLSMSHQREKLTLGLNANLVRDSTITSELLTTGLVGEVAERAERYVVSPSAAYYITDTDQLQLQGSYTKQDYSISTLTPYDNSSGQLDWIHIYNERIKLILSANYAKNEYDESGTYGIPSANLSVPVEVAPGFIIEQPVPAGSFGGQSYSSATETKGGQFGIDYQWSEQSLLQARVGSSNSKNTYSVSTDAFCSDPDYIYISQFASFRPYLGICGNDSSSREWTATLGWSWSNENQQFNLSGTKQTAPTGSGYTIDTTQLNTNWSYRLTELDVVSANIMLIRNRSLDDSNSIRNSAAANRNYETASLSYRRQLGEEWFVSGTYQYNHQKYTDMDIKADANIVSLTIQYKPQGKHWAR